MSDSLDEAACLDLLYRAGASNEIIIHATAVATRALRIAQRARAGGRQVDIDLVRAGALLHDIGRAVNGRGPEHAIAGSAWLRKRGCPEPVARCVETHMLAGLTAAEAKAAGLPYRDLIPTTLEEKIVAHADNLTGRTGPRELETVLSKLRRRGSSLDIIARIIRLDEELAAWIDKE